MKTEQLFFEEEASIYLLILYKFEIEVEEEMKYYGCIEYREDVFKVKLNYEDYQKSDAPENFVTEDQFFRMKEF
ncbi:hypothetical protein ACWN8B_00190 [Vagococcus zengguangii]|uniref:Uncharacterized protein n=1 Tax=Vagococcus zengguangii TaxID=2571750 RepID=A0A4D7CQ92_9ENTE|nr:hypothetical protein [Vagococcus zengguangii]QCI86335.1 hypothetical protein FA707_04865 [Vagococcus zengguangii]